MIRRSICYIVAAIAATTAWGMFACRSEASMARFTSSMGTVDVRLYNGATPLTVANFLNYATSNRYDGTFVHRKITNFVVQAGGFTLTPPNTPVNIPEDPAVLNEPGISNQRGTIAMAKLGGDPNSATTEWFFNWKDNSGAPPDGLDYQNGGFTAFGRVVGNGMTVIDAINNLPVFDLDGTGPTLYDSVPLRGASGAPLVDRLVFFTDISLLNLPAGDYNVDGKVDGADLAVWKADFGSTTKAEADGNGNGVVDGADFLVWQRTLGQNFGAPAAAAIAAIPEPAAATLALLAAAAGGLARRRSK